MGPRRDAEREANAYPAWSDLSTFQLPIPPDLIELEHIRRSGVQRCGNKAGVLGELRARGFPVPGGFCLPIAAYQQAGDNCTVSPALESALRAASDRLFLTSQYLAVRSSAALEDLPGASYAGLYRSVIGVCKPEDIGAAVQTVWMSYTSPSAVAARGGHHEYHSSDGMGVLIQPTINAEVAGVCFSVDPVQPLSGRLVINACWGLGVGVADGSIPADTLWLRREDLAVAEQRIVEKDTGFTLDSQVGLIRSPVTGSQRRAECLPKNWARRIAQFAMAAEQALKRPQDVEWAIAGGQVWILQSRPIASLAGHEALRSRLFPVDWEDPKDARQFWARAHFEGQGRAPLLPLDIDTIRLLESTRIETCLLMGADRNEDLLVICGQVYSSPAPLPLSKADVRVRRQAFQDLELRLVREGHTAWDHWGPEIERANERLTAVDTNRLDGSGLADFLEETMAARSRHNMLHPLMWFKPRQPYFDAFQSVSGLSGPEADSAAYRLLEGEESPLTRLVEELYGLAEAARGLPAVADWMRGAANHPTTPKSDALASFPRQAQGAAGWLVLFQAFLSEYGDRNGDGWGSEALITTPTWRDHPILAVQMAAQFLDEHVESPKRQRERSRRTAEAEVHRMCTQCPDSQLVEDFLQQLIAARRAQSVVEIHNHHIEQVGLGQLRRAVLAAAGWLQSEGVLSDADDVFWLSFSETLAVLRKSGEGTPAEIIRARKEEYHGWEQYEPPPHLGLPSAVLPPRPPDTDAVTPGIDHRVGLIRGVGASAGVVSGYARVIGSWQAMPRVQPGEILVAENAGPLWLPFFPILAGIVLEGGSLGQHAASTAREYGLPAVISAANATHSIKSGDRIKIDGTKGIVEMD